MIGSFALGTAIVAMCAAACASSGSASPAGAPTSSVSISRDPTSSVLDSSMPSSAVPTYETETATPAPPTGAVPYPPDVLCVYTGRDSVESAANEVPTVLAESDLVIEADVEVKFQPVASGEWLQLVDNVTVLSGRTTPAPEVRGLRVESDPNKPPFAWTPGRYILMLLPPYNGMSSPAQGMAGMFRLVDGQALRFCPNYQDPDHPIAASGTPPTVAQLLAQIPADLPTPDVPPKPGASP